MDEMAPSTTKQPGDSTGTAVRPQGCVLALASPSAFAGDTEEEEPVLGDGDQADDGEEEEVSDDDDSDDSCYGEGGKSNNSDDGYEEEEESDCEVEVPLKIDPRVAAGASAVRGGPPLLRGQYVPEGRFLGPAPRFASSGNTAGFLGVAVVVPPPADHPAATQEQGGDKEILVLYRYTEFEAAPGGVEVEVSKKTMMHYLRFAVPPAGDAAGSLQWVGSSLAPLIYPARHSSELQTLWSSLVSNVGIPPGTTRVKLIADVGILRLEDYTQGRMDVVMDALQGMIAEAWPGYHVGMELHLPEPVHLQSADADCERPAKRRKVVAEEVAGQECSVCFELLESDVAVWPGCSLPHVFHGACLALTLKESEVCPLCRRKLSAPNEHAT